MKRLERHASFSLLCDEIISLLYNSSFNLAFVVP